MDTTEETQFFLLLYATEVAVGAKSAISLKVLHQMPI